MFIHSNHANRILQQQQAVNSNNAATGKASASDAPSGGSGNSNSNSNTSTATITANDFLQLLVTELQNQDPTANTDPNEYVDQLVQVNSLQQLIQIDQNTTASSSSGNSGDGSSGSGSSDTVQAAASGTTTSAVHRAANVQHAANAGNLSPNLSQSSEFSAAANRIAGSLGPNAEKPSDLHASLPLQKFALQSR